MTQGAVDRRMTRIGITSRIFTTVTIAREFGEMEGFIKEKMTPNYNGFAGRINVMPISRRKDAEKNHKSVVYKNLKKPDTHRMLPGVRKIWERRNRG
jgi:hypothetical protein